MNSLADMVENSWNGTRSKRGFQFGIHARLCAGETRAESCR